MESMLAVSTNSGGGQVLYDFQVSGNLEKGTVTGIENTVFVCPSRFSLIPPSLSKLISELESTVADLLRSPALAGTDPVGDALGDVGVAWFLGQLTEASRLTPFNQAPAFGTPFICELSFHFRILYKLYMTQPAGI